MFLVTVRYYTWFDGVFGHQPNPWKQIIKSRFCVLWFYAPVQDDFDKVYLEELHTALKVQRSASERIIWTFLKLLRVLLSKRKDWFLLCGISKEASKLYLKANVRFSRRVIYTSRG